MADLQKLSLYKDHAVCVKAVHRRKMPLTSFDSLLWTLGEPLPAGDPPSNFPLIVENDFLVGDAPVRFPCNHDLSGEAYFVKPADRLKMRKNMVLAIEETGLEVWLADPDLAAIVPILQEVNRFYVNVLHDWALLDAVAIRRPNWEITFSSELGSARRNELVMLLVTRWKQQDGAPGDLTGLQLSDEELPLVTLAARG